MRSGYDEYGDDDYIWLYRNSVDRAIAGKRGQAFLKELLASLDAMPEKRLIAEELQTPEGEVCSLGAVGRARGIDLSNVSPEAWKYLGKTFNIAESMVREIEFINDDEYAYYSHSETPEERWVRMRKWVAEQLKAQ